MADKMDAIAMLEEDHKKVKGLFREYEKGVIRVASSDRWKNERGRGPEAEPS